MQVFIYDISELNLPEIMLQGDDNVHSLHQNQASTDPSPSCIWKILHAQVSGKSYGVVVNKNTSSVLTHGSESSLKVWSMTSRIK